MHTGKAFIWFSQTLGQRPEIQSSRAETHAEPSAHLEAQLGADTRQKTILIFSILPSGLGPVSRSGQSSILSSCS